MISPAHLRSKLETSISSKESSYYGNKIEHLKKKEKNIRDTIRNYFTIQTNNSTIYNNELSLKAILYTTIKLWTFLPLGEVEKNSSANTFYIINDDTRVKYNINDLLNVEEIKEIEEVNEIRKGTQFLFNYKRSKIDTEETKDYDFIYWNEEGILQGTNEYVQYFAGIPWQINVYEITSRIADVSFTCLHHKKVLRYILYHEGRLTSEFAYFNGEFYYTTIYQTYSEIKRCSEGSTLKLFDGKIESISSCNNCLVITHIDSKHEKSILLLS